MEKDVHRELTFSVVGAAIEVHKNLGPGLLEGTYRACLIEQLIMDGIEVMSEIDIPITYKGRQTGACYRADLIVQNSALVELKATERLLPVHSAQLLSYLRLTGLPVDLLINFNVPKLTDGVRRFANTSSTRAAVDFPIALARDS
jgi:GxxExxY protein